MLEELATQAFWIGLAKIIGVNVVLSGDNAVVIALAARSLPPRQQRLAIRWGAGAAVALRIILTLFAVALLQLPWLKIAGGLLLIWIGVRLLAPNEDGGHVDSGSSLVEAIKTILVADLVMSIDNVIAVAAAAQGSYLLLVLGLAISIPLVVFGATLLVGLMGRYPVIVTVGAALIGFVAGEMLATDPALTGWLADAGMPFHGGHPTVLEIELGVLAGALGSLAVVAWGKMLARRQVARTADSQNS